MRVKLAGMNTRRFADSQIAGVVATTQGSAPANSFVAPADMTVADAVFLGGFSFFGGDR